MGVASFKDYMFYSLRFRNGWPSPKQLCWQTEVYGELGLSADRLAELKAPGLI